MRRIEFGTRVQNVLTVLKGMLVACLILGVSCSDPEISSTLRKEARFRSPSRDGRPWAFVDVDHVCLQRVERIEPISDPKSGIRQDSFPIALFGNRGGDGALHLHQYRLRLARCLRRK